MKHKKKYISALITAFMMLSGCQLAQEGRAGIWGGEDQLIGAFITRGSGLRLENEAEDRLYADFDKEEEDFRFDQEGYRFFSATIEGEAGTYIKQAGDAVSDVKSHYIAESGGRRIITEGTIYFAPGNEHDAWFIHPVYQESGGDVYTVPSGSGIGISHILGEGSQGSQKLEETAAVMEEGKRMSVETTLNINLSMMYRPVRTVILEMDEKSTVLAEKAYEAGDLPEIYKPGAETAFIIVETHKKGPEGKDVVAREILDRKSEALNAFSLVDGGVILQQHITLQWTGR